MALYTILQIINHDRVTEHTNVGVGIYDDTGNLQLVRADTSDRAVARRDLKAEHAHPQAFFENYLRSAPTIEGLRKRFEGFGHAMSYIQFREPLWTRSCDQETLDRIFNQFVLGISTPLSPPKPGTSVDTIVGGGV